MVPVRQTLDNIDMTVIKTNTQRGAGRQDTRPRGSRRTRLEKVQAGLALHMEHPDLAAWLLQEPPVEAARPRMSRRVQERLAREALEVILGRHALEKSRAKARDRGVRLRQAETVFMYATPDRDDHDIEPADRASTITTTPTAETTAAPLAPEAVQTGVVEQAPLPAPVEPTEVVVEAEAEGAPAIEEEEDDMGHGRRGGKGARKKLKALRPEAAKQHHEVSKLARKLRRHADKIERHAARQHDEENNDKDANEEEDEKPLVHGRECYRKRCSEDLRVKLGRRAEERRRSVRRSSEVRAKHAHTHGLYDREESGAQPEVKTPVTCAIVAPPGVEECAAVVTEAPVVVTIALEPVETVRADAPAAIVKDAAVEEEEGEGVMESEEALGAGRGGKRDKKLRKAATKQVRETRKLARKLRRHADKMEARGAGEEEDADEGNGVVVVVRGRECYRRCCSEDLRVKLGRRAEERRRSVRRSSEVRAKHDDTHGLYDREESGAQPEVKAPEASGDEVQGATEPEIAAPVADAVEAPVVEAAEIQEVAATAVHEGRGRARDKPKKGARGAMRAPALDGTPDDVAGRRVSRPQQKKDADLYKVFKTARKIAYFEARLRAKQALKAQGAGGEGVDEEEQHEEGARHHGKDFRRWQSKARVQLKRAEKLQKRVLALIARYAVVQEV
jgi:hypothetical protein